MRHTLHTIASFTQKRQQEELTAFYSFQIIRGHPVRASLVFDLVRSQLELIPCRRPTVRLLLSVAIPDAIVRDGGHRSVSYRRYFQRRLWYGQPTLFIVSGKTTQSPTFLDDSDDFSRFSAISVRCVLLAAGGFAIWISATKRGCSL